MHSASPFFIQQGTGWPGFSLILNFTAVTSYSDQRYVIAFIAFFKVRFITFKSSLMINKFVNPFFEEWGGGY